MNASFNLANAKGLIFDCDGTLLDTMPVWNELESRMAREAGVVLNEEQLEELRAAPSNQCAAIFHERYGLGKDAADVLRMMDETLMGFYRDEARALPGVKVLLEQARAAGVPCTVVTSSPRRYVEPGLIRAGINDYFLKLFTTDEAGCSKQEAGIWQMAIEAMGATPETTWGFDDAVYAVRAMSAVGIHAIGAYDCDETGTFEQLDEAAEFAIHSLEELLA